MNITGIAHYHRRFGYLGASLSCQVTRCELDGQTGYVRENLRNVSGLTVSSNYRIGITGGIIRGRLRPGTIPKHAVEVLELAAPAAIWERMAETVARLDRKRRTVVRSRNWTIPKATILSYEPHPTHLPPPPR